MQTAGGSAAAANATDLGSFLQRSDAAAGVEVQQRNAVSVDPRIRGYRTGQYYTTSAGAPFFPARLDLDTPVSKFDPGSIGGVTVVRGPYTSLLGPGFAYLDIAPLDSPRSKDRCGTEYHGRSGFGYQSNGNQVNALQSVEVGGPNWGFRGTYNLLQGNDYRDGAGTTIPASYLSNNFNYALGFDLTENSSLEFHGLRVRQSNLEFPGLYFDIRQIDTEAYSLKYTARKVGIFDAITLDTWYNTTAGTGDTQNFAKQFFVSNLLGFSFLPPGTLLQPGPGGGLYSPYQFRDESTTSFAERSIGYRLAGVWGNNKDEATITAGTDLNVFGQGLVENIRFNQTGGPAIPGAPLGTTLTQNQGIPNSNFTDAGLFVESMLPLLDKRVKLRSGGRLDFARASSGPRLITGNVDLFGPAQVVLPNPQTVLDPAIYSASTRTDLTRDFTLFSGFATAELLVTDSTTLFLNYGYAERAPTLTELYATGPFIGVLQQGTSRLIGDPGLAKERLNQFDVGLKYENDWLRAGATAFYAWVHDYITYDANKLNANGLSQVVYTNTDLATLAGTELYVSFDMTEMISPFATLSYVQGIDQTHVDSRRPANLASSRRESPATREFATQTEPLPQIPPMEARAGLRFHQACKDPKWQIEFNARMVAGQNNIARSLGELDTPGFTTFNLRGYWQVNRYWLVSSGVENIGDLLYREHLDPIASTVLRANTGIPVSPLYRPGTNVFVSSQLTY